MNRFSLRYRKLCGTSVVLLIVSMTMYSMVNAAGDTAGSEASGPLACTILSNMCANEAAGFCNALISRQCGAMEPSPWTDLESGERATFFYALAFIFLAVAWLAQNVSGGSFGPSHAPGGRATMRHRPGLLSHNLVAMRC
ncbi:MAG: hypothetical protein Q8Q39_03465 [bacterium]|nr:hypothetical protein [bacterium]